MKTSVPAATAAAIAEGQALVLGRTRGLEVEVEEHRPSAGRAQAVERLRILRPRALGVRVEVGRYGEQRRLLHRRGGGDRLGDGEGPGGGAGVEREQVQ